MPDQPSTRSQRTAARSAARPTDEAEADDPQEQLFGDLSEAAREAVRQPADPRIDAHLARMGLTGDAAPAATLSPAGASPVPARPAPADPVPARPVLPPTPAPLGAETPVSPLALPATASEPDPTLAALTASVATLGATLTRAEASIRRLTWLLIAVAVVALVALALALR